MKKKILLLTPFILLASCAKNSYSFTNKEYPKGELTTFDIDENMTIDGRANEKEYAGLESFDITDPEFNVTVKTRVYFGNKGLFIFAESNDTSVFYSASKQIYQNDGIEMQLSFDPEATLSTASLSKRNRITQNEIQIRTDVSGNIQTWMGNGLIGSYEWTMYYVPVKAVTYVDGKINVENGAKGFSTEFFIPYSSMKLDSIPDEISIMPSFNNAGSNLDTQRKWYTSKGMSHNNPSSWVKVDRHGFIYDGKGARPEKELLASWDDEYYKDQKCATLKEVTSSNENPADRAYFYSFYDSEGVYVYIKAYDKALNHFSDNIWINDGCEFIIDVSNKTSDSTYRNGIFRFGFDIDGGIESNMCRNGYNNYIPYMMAKFGKTSIEEIEEFGDYKYNYKYTYEAFIPFTAMNTTYDDIKNVRVNFAIKSPQEIAYIENRRNGGTGQMEGQDWLWIDKHYPMNGNEFFTVTPIGLK